MAPDTQSDCGHNRFLGCFSGGDEQERSCELGCKCATLHGSKRKVACTTCVHRDFVNSTTTLLKDTKFTNHEALPSLHDAYSRFMEVYPKYEESRPADDIRDEEYGHLRQNDHVCMDYFGIGLFSNLQQKLDLAKSSFNISYSSANLCSQARYGGPEKGSLEFDIKKRIFRFLNIMESDYSLVFTASRGSAFKILAESYPFNMNKRLLTVYDYESNGLNWMIETSKKKGAKIMSAHFRWPSLRICSAELRKTLVDKKKKRNASAKGLFVFPAQSRLTGAKYSYQWMNQAQQKGWHVLLDACALGPKDMDSLGLSLFQPDFIISSFFKVYGTDPTGFGCLFVRKSSVHLLDSSPGAIGVGVVKIVPVKIIPFSLSFRDGNEEIQEVHERSDETEASPVEHHKLVTVSSFSGPVSMLQRANWSQKEKSIETSEHEHSDSDSGQTSGTESVMGTEPGNELIKSIRHHPSSSFENTNLVLTDEDYSADDDSRHRKLREQGSSSVREIEELEGEEEWQKQGSNVEGRIHSIHEIEELEELEGKEEWQQQGSNVEGRIRSIHEIEELEGEEKLQNQSYIFSEQGRIHTKYHFETSESKEEREAERMDERLHTHNKGEKSVTEASETHNTTYWSVGEPSQTVIDTQIEYKAATKVTLGEIFEKDPESSFDENTTEEEKKSSTEKESANSLEETSTDPQIYCKSLDHADSLGLVTINNRMRYLINWLVNALMKLRHPSSENGHRLVKIYGPKIKFERGNAVAFNLYDWKGELVEPMLVQKLADRSNISLRCDFLCNIYFPVKHADKINLLEPKYSDGKARDKHGKEGDKVVGLTVVTAALGFLSNFEDIYRLWVFLAKFLDADFVQKERWRYRSLNQQTIEL